MKDAIEATSFYVWRRQKHENMKAPEVMLWYVPCLADDRTTPESIDVHVETVMLA